MSNKTSKNKLFTHSKQNLAGICGQNTLYGNHWWHQVKKLTQPSQNAPNVHSLMHQINKSVLCSCKTAESKKHKNGKCGMDWCIMVNHSKWTCKINNNGDHIAIYSVCSDIFHASNINAPSLIVLTSPTIFTWSTHS